MSKDKRNMTRKRFTKLVAAQYHLQVPAVRDALMHGCVYQSKRDQERSNMENHRYKTQKTSAEDVHNGN